MFRLKESIHVNAPLERCFLLSTSIDLVRRTLKMTPVEGDARWRATGLIVGGDRVHWRGWQFGLPARHDSLITGYERPSFFQDSMESGYFKTFQHDHRFEEVGGRTLLVDIVRFSMPFGFAGKAVGKAIVVPHVLGLLLRRFELLKRVAEGPDWESYLGEERAGRSIAADGPRIS